MQSKKGNPKRNKKRFAFLTMTLALLPGLSACGSGQDSRPVLAERTEETRETDVASAGEKEENSESILGLLELPERYQAQVETDRMSLSGDAEITVPENVSMKTAQVQARPYSEEELEALLEATAVEGISWDETSRRQIDAAVDMDSEDGNYLLSFVDGVTGNTPVVFVTDYSRSVGTKLTTEEAETGLSQGEREILEEQLQEKAEKILKILSEDSFSMELPQWCRINDKNQENAGLGLSFTFRRTWMGSPVMNAGQPLLGQPAASIQYVRISFAEDGSLLEIKDIGRENIEEDGSDAGFCLPFAAIAEVFEQYCRSYYQDENHFVASLFSRETKEVPTAGAYPVIALQVNRVCLEYRYQAKREEGSSFVLSGNLVPVWNFYGTGIVGWDSALGNEEDMMNIQAQPILDGEEMLFVSIGARDGMVYGN